MDEFDWDELQVIKDPDAKQVEVSFIKDDEGGTIGSELPCVRILAPNDYFPYKDNSGHFYVAYLYEPAPVEITGVVTHTTGGTCEPNSIVVPTEMDATSTFTIPKGSTEVRVDLTLNTVLVDVSQTPDYKAAYTATITSVTNGNACGEAQCIKFWAGTSVIPDPEDPGPEPDPETDIPPDDDQFPECQPHDCDAYKIALFEGMTLGTIAEMESLYSYTTTPLEIGNIRFITNYDTATKQWPSVIGGYDWIDFRAGNNIVDYPCTGDIKVLSFPSAISAYAGTAMSQATANSLEHSGPLSDGAGARSLLGTKEATVSYRAAIYAPENSGSFIAMSLGIPYYVNGANTRFSFACTLTWDRIAKTLTLDISGVTKVVTYDGGPVIDINVIGTIRSTYTPPGAGFGNTTNFGSCGISIAGGGGATVEVSQSSDVIFDYYEGNHSASPCEFLAEAQVLAIASGIDASTVDSIIENAKRAMQSYTPPTYCSRIP
jgi:hypothetical protein